MGYVTWNEYIKDMEEYNYFTNDTYQNYNSSHLSNKDLGNYRKLVREIIKKVKIWLNTTIA